MLPRDRRLTALVFTAFFAIVAFGCPLICDSLKAAEKVAHIEPFKLYGFCVAEGDNQHRTLPEQAKLLRELGFDGAGFSLWFGDKLDKNLKTLDEAQLPVNLLWTSVNLKPGATPLDPRVLDAIKKLKGHPVTVAVLLQGLPPADPRGTETAVLALRKLGDAAAEANIKIAVYHHAGDWAESLSHAASIVKQVNHPQVGLCFNLCHWLKIEGRKDYRPVLRENASKIFAVTINGAQLDAKTWTNGLIQPLDAGDFDNRPLLTTLREIGYRGPIGLMCFGIPGDARDHLQRSMRVWKSWQSPATPAR